MEFTKEQELYQQVVQKAWGDEAFKAELVANPVAAIEKVTGGKLSIPEGKKIVVRDQTGESTVYINIPAMPEADVELNEAELERVAGGCQHGDSGTFTIIQFPKLPPIIPPYQDDNFSIQ